MKKANLFYVLLIGLILLTNTLLSISFDDIEVWIGEGENQAGMVIDFEDGLEPTTLAWGYRWDGVKNGRDMLIDIIAADPRLSGDGFTPETMNYDLNNDGVLDENDHVRTIDSSAGNFWCYYEGTSSSDWQFSNLGHAGRTLVDGQWDAWSFVEDWNSFPYPEIDEAVPAPAATTTITFEDIEYWIGEGSSQAMMIIDWQTEDEIHSYAWGYNFTVLTDATEMITEIAAEDARLSVEWQGSFVKKLIFDEDLDGTPEFTAENGDDGYWNSFKKNDTGWITAGNMSTAIQAEERFGFAYGMLENYDGLDNASVVPVYEPVDEDLEFEELIVWCGEGANQAMFVVDFNAGDDPQSYAWGYRWDGEADGTAMMTALVELDPRLIIEISSNFLTDITLDIDNDGTLDYGIYDDNDNWSTWSKPENGEWNWNSGCATALENNGRFGCSYGFIPESTQPGNPIAMPELPATDEDLEFEELIVWCGEGANQAMFVVDFNAGDDPQSYAWGYRWDGEADGTAMMTALAELDPRLTIEISSNFLTDITLDIDNDGTLDYGIYDDNDNWSTWSKPENGEWNWNSGCATALENNGRFGCSYGFIPESTQPDVAVAIPEFTVIENEAPVANNETAIVKNSVNNLLPILLNDEDADNNIDISTINITVAASHGTVILNEDGTVTYSSEAGYEGDDSFSYTVADSVGAVSNAAVCELTVVTPFSGAVGEDDCEAIAAESNLFVSWATGITLERGFMDISDEAAGYVTYGSEDDALGQAEGTSMNVVSLGDGGNAVLTFEEAICDEDGADFAIFENSFSNTFLELAFVEVSSDGENFFRFPATSYTQLFTQITDSDAILAEDINNLAGKYKQGFGTPFDLAELAETDGLDINQITHVKIIDAVGSLNPEYATYDAQEIIVNEPWPTVSASGGFDLDGVGVIHQTPIVSSPDAPELVMELKNSYPNPFMPGSTRAGVKIAFSLVKPQNVNVEIYNIKGQQVATVCDRKFAEGNNVVSWNGKDKNGNTASSGVYFYRMQTKDFKQTKRLMIVK